MKFFYCFVLLFLIFLFSCSKSTDVQVPPCDFFPVAKGQKITYSRATVANLTPDQIKYTDRSAQVLDSSIIIDDNRFYFYDCVNQKVLYNRTGKSKLVLFDNTKGSSSQIIFSDQNYTVVQYKDASNSLFSLAKSNAADHEFLSAVFKPGTGVIAFSIINENSGNETTRYKLK